MTDWFRNLRQTHKRRAPSASDETSNSADDDELSANTVSSSLRAVDPCAAETWCMISRLLALKNNPAHTLDEDDEVLGAAGALLNIKGCIP